MKNMIAGHLARISGQSHRRAIRRRGGGGVASLLRLPHCVALLAACLASSSATGAEPPAEQLPAARPDAFQEYTRQAAAAYEVRVATGDGQEQVATLIEQPILRWTNPLDRAQAHGDVFLWTERGRPAAVLSVYQFTTAASETGEHNEFCSLAESGLTADNSKGRTWTPGDPGVELKRIEDAALPADTPRLRLRQMRELAERFAAEKITRDEVQRSLRLLPQAVYRYEAGRADILDGALFAFVEATDPEVLLLVEARSNGSGHEWQYAFARMNSVRLRGFYREQAVWEAPVLQWRDVLNRPDKTYTALTIQVQ